MGCAGLSKNTNLELQRLIRKRATDTRLVLLTDHAKQRMLERQISIHEVHDVLREGLIVRPWQKSEDQESVECRMERYVAGRDLAVIVALADEDVDVLVVTAFEDE